MNYSRTIWQVRREQASHSVTGHIISISDCKSQTDSPKRISQKPNKIKNLIQSKPHHINLIITQIITNKCLTAAQILGALMARTYDCRVTSHSYVCLSFGNVRPIQSSTRPCRCCKSKMRKVTRNGEMERSNL